MWAWWEVGLLLVGVVVYLSYARHHARGVELLAKHPRDNIKRERIPAEYRVGGEHGGSPCASEATLNEEPQPACVDYPTEDPAL